MATQSELNARLERILDIAGRKDLDELFVRMDATEEVERRNKEDADIHGGCPGNGIVDRAWEEVLD